MPQPSILYAVARTRMQSRHLLSASHIQRLLTAPTEEEARRVLREAGYLTPEQTDIEQVSVERQLAAYRLVRGLSPEPGVTDAFLLRHDVNNLKILFKARVLGEEPAVLSPGGTIDVALLRQAVFDRSYGRLPVPVKRAMDALEKRSAEQINPMEVDVLLDQALYSLMADAIDRSGFSSVRGWMAMRADYANLRAFLRLRDVDTGLPMRQVLVKGGSIPPGIFVKALQEPERLLVAVRIRYHAALAALAQQALQEQNAVAEVEKRMDEQLSKTFLSKRLAPDDLDALLHYMLSVEKESAAVRLIMAGKRNKMSSDQIERRLRSGYGR